MYQPFAFLNICFEGSGKTKDGKRKNKDKKNNKYVNIICKKKKPFNWCFNADVSVFLGSTEHKESWGILINSEIKDLDFYPNGLVGFSWEELSFFLFFTNSMKYGVKDEEWQLITQAGV